MGEELERKTNEAVGRTPIKEEEMPISTTALTRGAEGLNERKPRQNKAERPFSPPGLGLEASDYVKSALEAHYLRLDQDPDYKERFEEYRLYQQEETIARERALRAREWTGPAPIRVRGSEIKSCARQTFFRLIKAPGKTIGKDNPHWKLAARFGEVLHGELEIALKFLGLVERSEYHVRSPTNDYVGRVDIRLKNAPVILDIKTVKPEDFKEGPWAEKVPGYIEQVTGYAYLEGCTIGAVLMVDRSSGRLMEFSWEVSPEAGEAVLKRASWIVGAAKARQVPPAEYREANRYDFRCHNFCPFEELCTRQQDGSVQIALDEGRDLRELIVGGGKSRWDN